MSDKKYHYTTIYNNIPTRNEFCVIDYMNKKPDNDYDIYDINSEFIDILWSNPISVYRILKGLESKGIIERNEYPYDKTFKLTDKGKRIGALEWQ